METEMTKKLAVLIDAENISYRYAKLALDEAAKFGVVICKRIYADWSNPAASSWKRVVQDYSINPIQQFSSAVGKNSSDSAMIIDAMDLLHEGKLQGFCIVSSDSDFTRLASRLRESEMQVIGMGEKKTPKSFISACDKFLYLDVLLGEKNPPPKGKQAPEQSRTAPPPQSEAAGEAQGGEQAQPEASSGMDREEICRAIAELVTENSDEDGWYFMGTLGNQLASKYPDFDSRNFGFAKLSGFVGSLDAYEFRRDTNPSNPNLKLVYIRKKS